MRDAIDNPRNGYCTLTVDIEIHREIGMHGDWHSKGTFVYYPLDF